MKLLVLEADHSALSQLADDFVAEQGFDLGLEAVFFRCKCNGKVHVFSKAIETHQAVILSAVSVILFIPILSLLLLIPLSLRISTTMDDQAINFNRMRVIECDELNSQS